MRTFLRAPLVLACFTVGCGFTEKNAGGRTDSTTAAGATTTSPAGSGGSASTANSSSGASTSAAGTASVADGSGGSTEGGAGGETWTTGGAAGNGEPGVCHSNAADPITEEAFPETVAEALCEWYESCGCTDAYGTAEACTAGVQAALEALRSDAAARGLTYDANCAGELVKYHDDLGCRHRLDALEGACYEPRCALYHGASEECTAQEQGVQLESACPPGTICRVIGPLETPTYECAANATGLIEEGQMGCALGQGACAGEAPSCVDNHCVAPAGLDEPCTGSQSGDNCAEGFCNEEDVCEAKRSENEPCSAQADCADELFCRGFDVCAARSRVGENCELINQPCAEGSKCSLLTNTCIAFAELGESCQQTDCAEGWCDVNTRTCVLLAQEGEPCDDQATYCDLELVCESGTCQSLPPVVCSAVLQF